jgi:hypothetical protein
VTRDKITFRWLCALHTSLESLYMRVARLIELRQRIFSSVFIVSLPFCGWLQFRSTLAKKTMFVTLQEPSIVLRCWKMCSASELLYGAISLDAFSILEYTAPQNIFKQRDAYRVRGSFTSACSGLTLYKFSTTLCYKGRDCSLSLKSTGFSIKHILYTFYCCNFTASSLLNF